MVRGNLILKRTFPWISQTFALNCFFPVLQIEILFLAEVIFIHCDWRRDLLLLRASRPADTIIVRLFNLHIKPVFVCMLDYHRKPDRIATVLIVTVGWPFTRPAASAGSVVRRRALQRAVNNWADKRRRSKMPVKCAICLGVEEVNCGTLCATKCGHVFHQECIGHWFRMYVDSSQPLNQTMDT
jgi:hypothetical protein